MYNEFAYYYDTLNRSANYRRLHGFIRRTLRRHGIRDGIVGDFGCGTGELTLRLARDGYDMLAADLSEDMLEVLSEKLAARPKLAARVQPLCQNILELDLFGTIRGAVSSFDTINHIGPEEQMRRAIARIAFFMEKDGVFIFDANTPYKHRCILADNSFRVEAPEAVCLWQNTLEKDACRTRVELTLTPKSGGDRTVRESFYEYFYSEEQLRGACEACGLRVETVLDGESFRPLAVHSQRIIFVAVKQYTQNETEEQQKCQN